MSQRSTIVSNSRTVSLLQSVVPGRIILIGLLGVLLLAYVVAMELRVGEAPVYLLLVGLLLHYFIFSRQISIPLVHSLLFCILILPLFVVNDIIGVSVFFIGSIHFFRQTLQDEEWFHISPLVIFYAGVIIHAALLSPLMLADSATYFAQLSTYASVQEFVQLFLSKVAANPIWIGNFVQKFPIVYLPFYFGLNITSPMYIVVINGTLWTLSTLMLTQLCSEHLQSRVEAFSPRLLFTLLLIGPSFILYASQFGKETVLLFFVILAVFLFFEKRYISFLVASGAAFYLRPYVIVAIAAYVFLFRGDRFFMALLSTVALLVLAVDSGMVVATVNGFVILPYMFISPLPFELGNWMSPRTSIRPIEALVTGGAAIVGTYVFLIARKYRTEYLLLGLGLLAWAFTLSWIGFAKVEIGNFDGPPYDFLVFAVHVVRKKMPVMPMVVMWVVLTVGGIREYVVDVTFRRE